MKTLYYLLILFFILSSCQNSQEKNTETKISLNGTWQFLASNEVNESDVFKEQSIQLDTIKVPGNWDTRKRYSEYVGKGYYQKQFEIPKNWNGKQIRLKFNAVYETAKVWLNGNLLGVHVGGYTPFDFNITDKIDFNKSNSIVVMADNTYKRGAWWAWGGISRDVTLYANEEVRIVYQHITSVPNFETKKVDFTIKYKLENSSKKDILTKIYASIDGIYADSLAISVKENSTTISEVKFQKELSKVKLWGFNSPNLYQLNSALKIFGNEVDLAQDKFGVRKFEVRGEQFYLNNIAVRMNGVNRVHDHPDYGNTEPDHLVKSDLLDIKSLGCNFSRLMHAPLSKNILKFCDSIGFLLVEEIPVWGDNDPQSYPNNPQTKQWLKEMIERDYNHPSIVGWSVGNELHDTNSSWKEKVLSEGQYGYVNSMLDYIDELDTSRLKTYASLSAYRGGTLENEPFDKIDFISINSYGDAVEHAQTTHEKFPGKPIFISEIGKGQIGPAPEAKLSDELVGYIKGLKDLPYVTGLSIWSYNDYRSNYKGTPESGFREWGIVDERRNKKKAYYQLKEVYKAWQE
ncbi:glycoside hydrolase family 2 protein [Polaribacter sp. Q13]|uniref:glycoside hydrolase family 2 protein n=1 Tax=Polaribacter sp. Q13 TaxID=2806551 RepID=UPI00193B195C|nr:glycoside hydrolase family 2 TIM barrel-domain containing protein [Polaribacter sp. Q13]QVY66129.1 glycoside hydrolase family 2 [Polaribacter sp. Q13]